MAGINNDKLFGSSAAIGSTFQSSSAPTSGAIIEGSLGVGASSITTAGDKVQITTTGTNTFLAITGDVAQQQAIRFYDSATRWILYKPSSTTDFRFLNGTSDVVTIQNDGDTGFSTTSPGSRVSVSGNLAVGASYATLAAPTSGAIIEGPVCIATSTASKMLTIQDQSADNTAQIRMAQSGATAFSYIGNFASSCYISAGGTFNGAWAGDTVNNTIPRIVITSTNADSNIAFGTSTTNNVNATERMRILGGGNVGIATTGPGSRLGVSGNFALGSTYAALSAPTNGAIIEGNTGIGTSTVASRLHIYEDTTSVNESAGLTIEQDGTGDSVAQFLLTGARRWVIGVDNSDSDKFKISPQTDLDNEVFTITTSGDVGIGIATPNALLHVQGSQAFKITVPGAYPYNILTTDYLVAVDTSSARSIVLPTAAAGNSGVNYIVKDIVGSAAANNITVTVNGGGNIDGAASSVLNQNYESRGFYSNGTQWFAI